MLIRIEIILDKSIVVIVPCFNEAERLNLFYFNELSKIHNTIWIFIDDGSTDNTSQILKKHSMKSNVMNLRIDRNVGKSKAIAFGADFASHEFSNIEWIGFLDSDGAFTVEDVSRIIKMTNSIKSYDAIYSSRVKLAGRNIKRNNARHILARLITSLFGLAWREIPYDTQSGFKLYRYSDDYKLMFIEPFRTKWFFDIEFSIRYLKYKEKEINVWEEPVTSWFDIPGSKINYRQVFRIGFEVVYIFFLLLNQRKNRFKNEIAW
jgi:glycosyltransferase involved in cell wall biosynthesis